jgi:hypothetical protein
MVTLADVQLLRHLALSKLISFILQDRMVAYRRDPYDHAQPAFNQFWVMRDRVLAGVLPAMGAAHERTCSAREAAKALHVSVRMIPTLARNGCLGDCTWRSAKLAKRGIPASAVESFSERFVLSRDLARKHRTSTRAIISHLTMAGVTPVVPSDTSRGISAVWRREDLHQTAIPVRRAVQMAQRH